jgi:hypothetical protein
MVEVTTSLTTTSAGDHATPSVPDMDTLQPSAASVDED